MKREDFESAIIDGQGHGDKGTPQAAEDCYELAKQMAIEFHKWCMQYESFLNSQGWTDEEAFQEWQNSKQ